MESIFKNKKILLGVTASIAAYKSPLIVRELVKLGAHVNVIMTPAAKNFVTPMTLTNVSRNPVAVEMFDKDLQDSGAWHIQLAHWADIALIAPCSATTLGKLANGICDNALSTVITALPREIPLLIAPSMDSTMWLNPSTQRNVRQMQTDGALIIPPGEGELSSGIIGPGRLPDISVVIDYVYRALKGWVYEEKSERVFMSDGGNKFKDNLEQIAEQHKAIEESDKLTAAIQLEQMKKAMSEKQQPQTLKGKKVVITAGPTHEKIDDVRFLGNHSSGKMGYAIATAARNAGANVVLVSGPVSLNPPEGVTTINVYSAQEMYDATIVEFPDADIGIMCAAVADYTLKKPFDGKLKKSETGP
jgi:phosphopantothenoylcysteine decarboxylase/phosphopantothenate--cysteine ligase